MIVASLIDDVMACSACLHSACVLSLVKYLSLETHDELCTEYVTVEFLALPKGFCIRRSEKVQLSVVNQALLYYIEVPGLTFLSTICLLIV